MTFCTPKKAFWYSIYKSGWIFFMRFCPFLGFFILLNFINVKWGRNWFLADSSMISFLINSSANLAHKSSIFGLNFNLAYTTEWLKCPISFASIVNSSENSIFSITLCTVSITFSTWSSTNTNNVKCALGTDTHAWLNLGSLFVTWFWIWVIWDLISSLSIWKARNQFGRFSLKTKTNINNETVLENPTKMSYLYLSILT